MENLLQNWRHFVADRRKRKMDETGITVLITFANQHYLAKLRMYATEIIIIPDDPNNPSILRLTPLTINGFDEETNRIHINHVWGSVDLQIENHECKDRVFNFLREISSDQSSDSGRSASPTD